MPRHPIPCLLASLAILGAAAPSEPVAESPEGGPEVVVKALRFSQGPPAYSFMVVNNGASAVRNLQLGRGYDLPGSSDDTFIEIAYETTVPTAMGSPDGWRGRHLYGQDPRRPLRHSPALIWYDWDAESPEALIPPGESLSGFSVQFPAPKNPTDGQRSPDLTATIFSVLLEGGKVIVGTVEPDGLAQAEISFEEAVALVADSGLEPPGVVDDDGGAEVRQYVSAADKILRVSRIDPDRVRAVRDTLVGEVARLDWDAYTALSGAYKRMLIRALGAIRDPGLTGFFMDQCWQGPLVAQSLAKLGEAALSAAIRNLEDPVRADSAHADPVCMMLTLIEFAKEINSPDSVYSTGEKQRFLELIRRDGLPAFRSSAFAQWEWRRMVRPAFASPQPPAKGVPLKEDWLRKIEDLVSVDVP